MQSIISWNIANINGLLGKKSDDPDFVKIIDGNDIICLQETVEEVQLPGYVSYSNLRASGKGGGVTTLIRKPLSGYCTPSNNCATVKGSMNLIIIQLAIDENCVFIINTYIPPSNSKGNKNCSAKHFDTLHRAVSNIREHHAGSILLCGDVNARIGCSQELANHKFAANILPCTSGSDFFSRVTVIPPGVPISTKRVCMDAGTNAHKKPFLELLGAHDLLTLNGRTIGDSQGRYTCYKWNGNSVVDYIAVSTDLLHQVKQFVVEPHTLFSDHNPIKLHLWSNRSSLPASVNTTNPTDAPLRYKITPDTITSFKNSLQGPNICDAITSLKDDIKNTSGAKEDVKDIAERISDLINNVARSNFQLSNPPKATKPKHDVWFKGKCSTARRLLKRSLKVVDNFPDHSNIKARHRQNNRNYRTLVNKTRDRFFDKLNDKIMAGKIISWRDFKKLKKFSKSSTSIDQDNLDPFRKFYEKLYADEHPSIDQLTKSALLNDAIDAADNSTPNETLNESFSIEELNRSIQQLKVGKASSFDQIPNEILKALDPNMRDLLLQLFNLCLKTGTYIWNKSVITPIHKKGCTTNPDNYRAIAVCSCIGKLLSTMLLNRLIVHRDTTCPDPPNQAGFKKGSQCNDHIFTLLTIMEKYRKMKSKVYAVFIDLRKAFDLVCRQALLFKLACYGVNGGFFHIIKDMYSNSIGHIKINGKISEAFRISKGTEQGHPLSPELFKVYFQKLSELLNKALTNCPTLSGLRVTHLAWADDLVILSLDPESLQKQIDILEKYCSDWGLEVNISKTKFMELNGKFTCNNSWRPTLNGQPIEKVASYCYLGVFISSNGKFNKAMDSLYHKGLGAYFSLRSTIDRRFIKAKGISKLFDSLVEPILTYGCQIWLPTLPVIKKLVRKYKHDGQVDINAIAKLPFEQVHLRHLKYLLGVNRRSANCAAWGETGKLPLIFGSIKLCIKYLNRAMAQPPTSFVKAALSEQICLDLSWFNNMRSLLECFGDITSSQYQTNTSPILNAARLLDLCQPVNIISRLEESFKNSWKLSISNSSKLSFYSSVKTTFSWESYLDHAWTFNDRRSTARIRCSSHKLNCETGRYKNIPKHERTCDHCTNIGVQLPDIENERHLLSKCPLGKSVRDDFETKLGKLTSKNPAVNIDSLLATVGSQLNADTSQINGRTTPADGSPKKEDIHAIQLSTRFIHKIYKLTLEQKKILRKI